MIQGEKFVNRFFNDIYGKKYLFLYFAKRLLNLN